MNRITRLIALVLLALIVQAQTPSFPASVADDGDLLVAKNRIQTALGLAIDASTNSIIVNSSSGMVANMTLTIDSEIVKVLGINLNQLTVQRGFDGTTAASHVIGSLVSGYIVAWHHNALAAEIKAIETTLGPNLSNVPSLFAGQPLDFGGAAALARSVMNGYWTPPPIQTNVVGVVNTADPGGDVPIAGLTSWIRQSSSGGDAVAMLPSCEVTVPNATCFGANIVLGSAGLSGATNPKLVGMEIDLQPYYTPTSDSYGLSILTYNVANPSPAIIIRNGNHAITPPAWAYAFMSEHGATNTALYAGTRGLPTGTPTNQLSQNIIFHSITAGGVHRDNEMFANADGKLTLNFAGIAPGAAYKTVQVGSCTTAATAGATCNNTINWPATGGAFPDTAYYATCSIQAANGTPYVLNEQAGRTATSAVFQIAALTAAASDGVLNCVAIHY